MEDGTLEIVVSLIAGLVIGFVICFSVLKQHYLAKYKKSVVELKTKYAGDVSQSITISKRLLEAEKQNEVLASEIAEKHSTIEVLTNQGAEKAARVARLETDLEVLQALVKTKEEELENYQKRLRINRNDLEYTAALEARLATVTNDLELLVIHHETEMKNLQHRLDDVENARNLLIQDLEAERRSAAQATGVTFEAPPTEIQELRLLVRNLIQEEQLVDEANTRALIEEALAEAQAAHQRAIQEKDVEIAQLLEYLSGVENQNAMAAKREAKLRETENLQNELQTHDQLLASEKAAREAELAEWVKRVEEIESAHTRILADKDAQITNLLERVGFIGTLRKQYAEKEQELKALEEKFQTAVSNKNLESHFLQERFDNLEKVHTSSIEELKLSYELQLAESDARIDQLQKQLSRLKESDSLDESQGKLLAQLEQYETALNAKDAEIANLHERLDALEMLFAAHSEEVDLKLQGKEAEILKSREDAEALEVFVAAHSQEIDARLQEKETEILELQECIAELEAADFLGQELKKMEAQYQAAMQTKNSEIVRLQMRIHQLESFSALVAQGDARIRELDSRYQIAIAAKDAEIARLQNRLKELNSNVQMAC